VKRLAEEYKGKLHLVVKFAPYPYRDYAKVAARAALAAREQGAFWPMHEKLLENYRKLDPKTILALAGELGLDTERFRRDLESERLAARVEEDVKLCKDLGLYQTPTFYINGRVVVGERPIEALRKIVDEELNAATKGKP